MLRFLHSSAVEVAGDARLSMPRRPADFTLFAAFFDYFFIIAFMLSPFFFFLR